MVDTWQSIFPILDADAPPDVTCRPALVQLRGQEHLEALCSFREDLVSVPVRAEHHCCHGLDVPVWNRILKEVAHAIDKHGSRRPPTQGFEKLVRDESWVEAVAVGVCGDAPESLSEGFGIAVLTSGADLGAAADRIPCRFRPLDF